MARCKLYDELVPESDKDDPTCTCGRSMRVIYCGQTMPPLSGGRIYIGKGGRGHGVSILALGITGRTFMQ